MNCNQLKTRALHDHNRAAHLAHDNDRMRDALAVIADMAERTTSALTMTDIARIARSALLGGLPADPTLEHPKGA
jgi:hypothetical protein